MSAELARFQAAMVEVLAREPEGARAREALLAHPDAVPFRAWVEEAEPRMLAVAAELVVRWGRPDPPTR